MLSVKDPQLFCNVNVIFRPHGQKNAVFMLDFVIADSLFHQNRDISSNKEVMAKTGFSQYSRYFVPGTKYSSFGFGLFSEKLRFRFLKKTQLQWRLRVLTPDQL